MRYRREVDRLEMLWLGPKPQSLEELYDVTSRRLILTTVGNVDELRARIPLARGVVVTVDCLPIAQAIATELAAHGGVLCLLARDTTDFDTITAALRAIPGDQREHIIFSTREASEIVRRHDPGPPLNGSLRIRGDKPPAQIEFLLRRAFNDCREIYLEELGGGRGSEAVYEVRAEFQNMPARYPLAYFAKVSPLKKWRRELDRYAEWVAPFIPFTARPNLDHARCLCDRKDGILIGNFVEQSEPLVDRARRGDAQSAIYSLFDDALRGWRTQSDSVVSSEYMFESLKWYADVGRVRASVIDAARATDGAFNFAELRKRLSDLPKLRHRRGIIHSDLHGQNVRVRGRDAILIDFYGAQIGPLAIDPAVLEVSLAFGEEREVVDFEKWKSIIDKLYGPLVNSVPSPSLHPSAREWIWNTTRQIRLFALPSCVSAEEYPAALVLAMVRLAGHPPSCKGTFDAYLSNVQRHAYLLIKALDILRECF